jgi:hypothetical protein
VFLIAFHVECRGSGKGCFSGSFAGLGVSGFAKKPGFSAGNRNFPQIVTGGSAAFTKERRRTE